ncbi:MAG: S49 family peptidase [Rhodobacteraceae bacterium]|nr:S49 family peptidase [Paracoccaceae bacterium]
MRKYIPGLKSHPVVSVVRLSGVIGGSSRLGGSGLSDAGVAPLLEKAFRKGNPEAVALVINSPGGSPVQSSLIGARIRRLAEETDTKVYAFCEDVAASGGYWLACAADEIYVDASSVVGSIGVISASFGFTGLLEKHGVERRVHTAGEDKSMLDPFRPERAEDVERLKELQRVIHGNFIDHVKARRGDKLSGDDLFTGEIWVGQKAVEVGLVDGVAHPVPFLKERFGDKVKFNVQGQRKSLLQRFGLAAAAQDVIGSVEDRTFWSRYGVQG